MTPSVLALVGELQNDEESLAAAEAALRQILELRDHARRSLTAADASALARLGVAETALGTVPRFTASSATMFADRAGWQSALTVPEVARLLGVSTARVRQRVAERSLWARRDAAAWRIPAVQFVDGREAPGWAIAARAIPAACSYVAVERVLTEPAARLEADGTALSPLTWLANGGDPARAATVIGDALTRLP